jgi:hypothetical protein
VKKFLTGVLALALVMTMAVPVWAKDATSVDTSNANTGNANTANDIGNVYVVTKAEYDTAYGAGAYDKLIASNTTKVADKVKADATKVTEALKAANIDTTKKTIAAAPKKVFELAPTVDLPKGDVTTEWKIEKGKFSDASLGTGTYLVIHVKDDGSAEYQVVHTKDGLVQEDLVFHGASPVGFYAVEDVKASTKSPKTGDVSVVLALLALAAAGTYVVSKKQVA